MQEKYQRFGMKPKITLSNLFHPSTGAPSIRKFHVLRDRRHVITRDSKDNITVWDVLKVSVSAS